MEAVSAVVGRDEVDAAVAVEIADRDVIGSAAAAGGALDLVEEARAAIGFTSKTDTVTFALREVVRRSRVQDLKALIGTVTYEVDPSETRKKDRDRVKRP